MALIYLVRSGLATIVKNVSVFIEFERDLESDLKGDTKGCFEKLLVSLCNNGRDESGKVDKDQAAADAKAIFEVQYSEL